MVLARRRVSMVLLGVGMLVGSCSRSEVDEGEPRADPGSAAEASLPEGAASLPEPVPIEASSLDPDETVRFLPTSAVLRDGIWQVPIEAWVFEPEEDDLSRAAVVELLGETVELPPGVLNTEVFEANLRPFFVDNERGQYLSIRRGAHAVRLGPTAHDGRASGLLPLPADDPAAVGEGVPAWVELEVVMPEGDARRLAAWSQLLTDEGISVISDIDDTIKITEVHDTAKLVENTFVRPFEAVPRMVAAYTRWAEQGVAFHYVSASPLPLEGALSRFAREAGFPRGSLSLRSFRWKDGTAAALLEPSEDYKREVIEAIVGRFMRRSFVLVGDTGERDPEIYAAVARAFPGRIRAIYLRDPQQGGTPGLSERLDAVFEGIPRERWRVIVDGDDLPASL